MGKRQDLTNKVFDKLTVLYFAGDDKWYCRCECGNEKAIRTYSLTSGRSKSCGKCSKFIDIKNQQFGDWKVLQYIGNRKWRCQCSCGTLRDISSLELRSGRTKSCGHATSGFRDLTNQKINHWTPIKYLGNKHWWCRCDCGTEQSIETAALTRGLSKQCLKCAARERTIDLTNKVFGDWIVLGPSDTQSGYWKCKCKKCNRIRDVHGYSLRSEKSTSCGCLGKTIEQRNIFSNKELLKEHIKELNTKLGHPPTSYEIANSLGVNYNSVNRQIKDDENIKVLMSVGDQHISNKEKELVDSIKSLGISGEDIILNDRKILSGQELDIYIPNKKLAIEFNGDYWHSNLYKDRKYHQNKTIDCAKRGIRLIHIFEYEWDNPDKRNIIFNIIRTALGLNNKILNARDTQIIDEIDTDLLKEFLEANHLQGYIKSSVNIGLKYNNKLVAVMTFGKPRFNQEYSYELLRLAFDSGLIVNGGTEKMFKHFIVSIDPTSIVSYSNIAKFNGGIYNKLNFKTISITEPNYVWSKPGVNVLTRYQTTKQKLISMGLDILGSTEDEIMENLGYYKIYDSGNLKFEWRRTLLNA